MVSILGSFENLILNFYLIFFSVPAVTLENLSCSICTVELQNLNIWCIWTSAILCNDVLIFMNCLEQKKIKVIMQSFGVKWTCQSLRGNWLKCFWAYTAYLLEASLCKDQFALDCSCYNDVTSLLVRTTVRFHPFLQVFFFQV